MAAEMDELVRLIEGEQIADVAYRERVICLVEWTYRVCLESTFARHE
jgi:hypothetical protein